MRRLRPGIMDPRIALALLVAALLGADGPKIGERLERRGDEIMVCGQLFHTTAPVVLWTDPGGYDAYRVERHFTPPEKASWAEAQASGLKSPSRFGSRIRAMEPDGRRRLAEEGWSLPLLQDVVDQFVIHYDVCGTSRRCFRVLHDERGLSVQFMLDLDGTIYQTLDLKDAASHATTSNARSVGIEIANIGAYPVGRPNPLDRWYERGPDGRTRITIPGGLGRQELRNPDAVLRPAREEPVVGTIQGRELVQYDLTPQQYDSLIKLTATLCTVFPKLRCDYPKDASGDLIPHKLPDEVLKDYRGILGHFHVQTNKTDPGPAFGWEKVIGGARALLKE